MTRLTPITILLLLVLLLGAACGQAAILPAPPLPAPSSTATVAPAPAPQSSPTPASTPTPTPVPNVIPTPTATTPAPAATTTPVPTPTPTPTPTSTPTSTPTPTPTPTAPPVSFQRDILPIFQSKCQECHAGLASGGLVLLDYNSLMTSGNDAPVVIKGDGAKSLLYLKVSGKPPMGAPMPLGDTLTDAQIKLILNWINQGAPDN